MEKDWIKWSGGSMPMAENTPHEVRFDDGDIVYDEQPQYWQWDHIKRPYRRNIVAYRIIKES